MTDEIKVEASGDIYSISISDPENGNAVSDAMIVRLGDVLEAAPADARVIVLRGTGRDFCVGRKAPPPSVNAAPLEALQLRRAHDIVFRVYRTVRESQIPVVAVVRGRAHGFGFALAAVADITLAADTASFQIPEFAHNIMPTMVMSALIDRVPLKALMHHVYAAEPFGAARALAIGAISDVCPEGDIESALAALLGKLRQAPRPALLAVKEYARNAQAIDLQKAVQYARALHAVVNTSSEMRRKDDK